jgi:quercetin dioxygenase-like cupin family protein
MDQREVTGKPAVVPRDEVPISGTPMDDHLEVRSFDGHGTLRTATPRSVGMALTFARPGQRIGSRSHPYRSLLVVLHGSADLVGPERRRLQQGDVITLPAEREYSLDGVGSEGLRALHIAFREEEERSEITTLEQLLAYNEFRATKALQSPYFQLLKNGGLVSHDRRSRLRDAIRVFSDAFQNVLFIRQATCADEKYAPVFHEHLTEEIGHNTLLTVPENRRAPADAILRATSSWFTHQMLVLDNIGKGALVHLVLETAGYHFHTLAAPLLTADVSSEYFQVHAEADDDHRKVATHFLADQHPNTYRRLHQIIERGWNVFDVMTSRFLHFVESEDEGREHSQPLAAGAEN